MKFVGNKMRYFFDTEFIEDGRTIDLVSIGIVSEDDRELYRCSTDAQLHRASDWVRANVLPRLPPYSDPAWQNRKKIADDVRVFLGNVSKPELWAYYADYDWVAFCQLFGRMIDLPNGFPKFCMDLKQLSVEKGSPRYPPQLTGEHDALADARWNRELYNFLTKK